MTYYFITEHYKPRLGGVTSYATQICENLANKREVFLIVPGENDITSVENVDGYTIVNIGVNVKLTGNISSESRIEFCNKAFSWLKNQDLDFKKSVIHNLFGFYLIRYFNFRYFKEKGVKTGVTIHNLPPAEGGLSWKGDSLFNYVKDETRKYFVGQVNKRRIQYFDFDNYIVPSEHVKELVSQVVSKEKIEVIHHGFNTPKCEKKKTSVVLKSIDVLTVAGFVPHKNQHIIPMISELLFKNGYTLNWHLVGPIRNKRYIAFIENEINKKNIKNIKFHISIPYKELINLYLSSDIYFQPSKEEGFCLTALDAASLGLPIIGTKTGAIPEIVQLNGGELVDSVINIDELLSAFEKVINNISAYKVNAVLNSEKINEKFTWNRSIIHFLSLYEH